MLRQLRRLPRFHHLLQEAPEVLPYRFGAGMVVSQFLNPDCQGSKEQRFCLRVASLRLVEVCQIVQRGGDSGMVCAELLPVSRHLDTIAQHRRRLTVLRKTRLVD